MTFNVERGTHPDLLDEVLAEQQAEAAPPPEARGGRTRTRRAAASPDVTPPPESSGESETGGAEGSSSPPVEGISSTPQQGETPEWLQSAREASSPEEMLNLLAKNLPRDALEKNDTLRGWVGNVAQRRAEALRQQEARDAQEHAKLEAAQRGDLYTLGELAAPEMNERLRQQQQAQTIEPFMEQVRQFQAGLPEAVQSEVGGKQYTSFAEYIAATVEAAARHSRETYFDQQLKEREPALRKAWLSQANGREQVPELDGGQATGVREITDEQLSRMSLEESDQYLDEKGQPRPGVRMRLTRGISLDRR